MAKKTTKKTEATVPKATEEQVKTDTPENIAEETKDNPISSAFTLGDILYRIGFDNVTVESASEEDLPKRDLKNRSTKESILTLCFRA